MAGSDPPEIRERAFRFACAVYDFCDGLSTHPGLPRRVAYQLFDAASSVGSNLEDAKAAYSRREFAAKNCISLKEARESHYWLRIAEAKDLGPKGPRQRLLCEANELVAILTTIVRQLRSERRISDF